MTAKNFLLIGGIILIILGIAGMIGLTGPTAVDSFFGSRWWFGQAENWAYLLAGIGAVVGSMILPTRGQKNLALGFGVAGVALALYSFLNPNLGGAHFEQPIEVIIFIIFGLTALISSRRPVIA